jgi:hypothetical protein
MPSISDQNALNEPAPNFVGVVEIPTKLKNGFGSALREKGLLCSLLIFAFLLTTNRYFSLKDDPEFISITAGDVWDYAAIADAAPALPSKILAYHHAQRFALPALAGLMGSWLGISNEWAMRAMVMIILLSAILLSERFANTLGFGTDMRTVLTALIFLNPYSARIGLAMPFMGNDLGFVLGLILILSGLYMKQAWRMLVGSIIAILCRQTAILFIFPMGFFFFARTKRYPIERLAAGACAVVVLAGYFFTGKIAASMSLQSQNLETLTGLFFWMAKDFDLKLLALEFGGRPLAALAVAVAALFLIAQHWSQNNASSGHRKKISRDHQTLCANAFLLTAGLIALQPILGGPAFGNLPRLIVLALWALVFGVALLLRDSNKTVKIRIPKWVLIPLLISLALHSFHHLFTWPGQFLLNGDPRWFFTMQAALCALLLAGFAVRSHLSVPNHL